MLYSKIFFNEQKTTDSKSFSELAGNKRLLK